MFLNSLCAALVSHQKPFDGKRTLQKLSAIDISTIEGRFTLLMELAAMSKALGLQSIADGKVEIPSLEKIRAKLIETNSMSHNMTVVSFAMKLIMQELSFEIISATNNQADFSMIPEVYTGARPITEFIEAPATVTFFNKVYSFTGVSGKDYKGVGIADLSKYKTDELIDILSGMRLPDKDLSDVRDYLVNHPDEVKAEFKNHRMGMLPFLKYYLDPACGDSKPVEFAREKIIELNKAIVTNALPSVENPGDIPAVGTPVKTDDEVISSLVGDDKKPVDIIYDDGEGDEDKKSELDF